MRLSQIKAKADIRNSFATWPGKSGISGLAVVNLQEVLYNRRNKAAVWFAVKRLLVWPGQAGFLLQLRISVLIM